MLILYWFLCVYYEKVQEITTNIIHCYSSYNNMQVEGSSEWIHRFENKTKESTLILFQIIYFLTILFIIIQSLRGLLLTNWYRISTLRKFNCSLSNYLWDMLNIVQHAQIKAKKRILFNYIFSNRNFQL